jgi:hypothetical protein
VKSVSQYALPANAARRLPEIANAMEAPHGFIDVGQLNLTFLREGGSPDEYRAGIELLKRDGLPCTQVGRGSPSLTRARSASRKDPPVGTIAHAAAFLHRRKQKAKATARKRPTSPIGKTGPRKANPKYKRRAREPWTPQEVRELKALAKGNTPTGVISVKLQRPPTAIRSKAQREGISLRPSNRSPYNRSKTRKGRR